MFKKFIAAFVLIFFAASLHTTAFAAEETKFVTFDGVTVELDTLGDFLEKDGVIFARGEALGPSNWNKQDSFYKTFARQAARITALRYLAEYLQGIKVQSTPNIEEIKVKAELVHDSKVFKLLQKNARQVGNATFDENGLCNVFMAIRIESRSPTVSPIK